MLKVKFLTERTVNCKLVEDFAGRMAANWEGSCFVKQKWRVVSGFFWYNIEISPRKAVNYEQICDYIRNRYAD